LFRLKFKPATFERKIAYELNSSPELKSSVDGRKVLNSQRRHWENTFTENPDLFGLKPSHSARKAAELFKKQGGRKILELGGGQGRDTLFLARSGFRVHTIDYTLKGVDAITAKAKESRLLKSIRAIQHDVRKPLPFHDESFDCCYSHMLYSMALTTKELEFLSQEVRRILRPQGLNVYTVRNINDSHYRKGIHRGEDMYEVDGFIVHFFSRAKVKHLSNGYDILEIEEFQEGPLPRKLFAVTLRKKLSS